jgi:hypothetical protein
MKWSMSQASTESDLVPQRIATKLAVEWGIPLRRFTHSTGHRGDLVRLRKSRVYKDSGERLRLLPVALVDLDDA